MTPSNTVTVSLSRVGYVPPERNAPCHCGSGKKFKKCHRLIEHEEQRQRSEAFRERIAAEAAEAREKRIYERHFGRDDGGRGRRALMSLVAMASSVGGG